MFCDSTLAGIAFGLAGLTFCFYTSLHGDLVANGTVSVAVIGGVLLVLRLPQSRTLRYSVRLLISAWLIHSVVFCFVLMQDTQPLSHGIGRLISIVYLVYCALIVLGSIMFTAIAMGAVAITRRRLRNHILVHTNG